MTSCKQVWCVVHARPNCIALFQPRTHHSYVSQVVNKFARASYMQHELRRVNQSCNSLQRPKSSCKEVVRVMYITRKPRIALISTPNENHYLVTRIVFIYMAQFNENGYFSH